MATIRNPPDCGWAELFMGAFTRSRNAMVLLDERRRFVDVNGAYVQLVGYRRSALLGRQVSEFVIGGPIVSEREWRAALRQGQFTAVGDLRREDGGQVRVEFAGHPATVAGQQLVLFVALTTSRRRRRFPAAPPEPAPLSNRELEVVRLIALGASGPEIAQELDVAHNTVRTHVRNSMTKLGARSRAQLVAMLLGEGAFWTEG
jgi:PAS domain S-box-containing protein